MLTVANLQQLLSGLPSDSEILVDGSSVRAVLRFYGKDAPDSISLDDSDDFIEDLDSGIATVLWRGKEV